MKDIRRAMIDIRRAMKDIRRLRAWRRPLSVRKSLKRGSVGIDISGRLRNGGEVKVLEYGAVHGDI